MFAGFGYEADARAGEAHDDRPPLGAVDPAALRGQYDTAAAAAAAAAAGGAAAGGEGALAAVPQYGAAVPAPSPLRPVSLFGAGAWGGGGKWWEGVCGGCMPQEAGRRGRGRGRGRGRQGAKPTCEPTSPTCFPPSFFLDAPTYIYTYTQTRTDTYTHFTTAQSCVLSVLVPPNTRQYTRTHTRLDTGGEPDAAAAAASAAQLAAARRELGGTLEALRGLFAAYDWAPSPLQVGREEEGGREVVFVISSKQRVIGNAKEVVTEGRREGVASIMY